VPRPRRWTVACAAASQPTSTRTSRRASIAAAVIALVGATARPALGQTPPLRRGVALAEWFHLGGTRAAGDPQFAEIRRAGFDHVRVPVDPVLLGWSWQPGAALRDAARLRDAVTALVRGGLDVVVDFHPDDSVSRWIEEDPGGGEALAHLWRSVVDALSPLGPEHVAFEVMNEPQFYGRAERWARIQHAAFAAIRARAPGHLVVLTGARGGSAEGLLAVVPEADPNVEYTFHFYLPYVFTHQGAPWMADDPNTAAASVRGLAYPAAQVREAAPTFLPDRRAFAAREVARYLADDWGAARVRALFEPVARWATSHHARVTCGEFGVLRTHVDRTSRYRWIGDVRRAAESSGMGWTVWDYAGAFGMTADASAGPGAAIEPEALDALGLSGPAAKGSGGSGSGGP
jgi:endoglucanase